MLEDLMSSNGLSSDVVYEDVLKRDFFLTMFGVPEVLLLLAPGWIALGSVPPSLPGRPVWELFPVGNWGGNTPIT